MNNDKQMVIDYDLAREAINQLLDELDRLDGSDSEWAETQKSVIRNSLDDCFDLAVKAKSHAAALAKAEERCRVLEEALAFIRDCEDDGEEFGPIVTVGFLKEQARAALE